MKKNYLILLLFTLIYTSVSFSQTCPEISFVVPLPTEEVLFVYDDPGPDCMDRPATVTIDGSTYTLGNCDTYSSRYVLTSGSGVIDPDNYTVTYGSLTCTYSDGTILGLENLNNLLAKKIKLYPNPTYGSELEIDFDLPMTAKIELYNILGEVVIKDELLNANAVKKLNIKNLNAGLYLLQFNTEIGRITKKVLITE